MPISAADRDWADERIGAAATGGLPADELARLETLAAAEPEIGTALAAARGLDRDLDALFAPTRPGPAVEVRVVRRMRAEWGARPAVNGWARKLAYGLAASVALGTTGAATSLLADQGKLLMPWEVASASGSRSHLSKKNGTVTIANLSDLTNSDFEPDPQLPATHYRDSKANWGVRLSSTDHTSLMSEADSLARSKADDNTARFGEARGEKFGNQPAPPADTNGRIDDARGTTTFNKTTNGSVAPGDKDQKQLFSFYSGNYSDGVAPTVPQSPLSGSGKMSGYDLYFVPEQWKEPKKDEVLLGRNLALGVTVNPSPAAPALPAGLPPTAPSDPKPAAPEPAPAALQPPPPPATTPAVGTPPAAPTIRKVIIRTGDIEFEIDSFDSAVATVTKLINAIDGAYVGTVNSEKLANGKVKGSVVVRVPPDKLDGLVLDLRKDLGKVGELKGQRIGSQDVSKQYTDLESRLKAARTMETRLLQMIKEGKGEIKQLLDAEKELGIWRTKIEEYEGELRYYSNQASLSTLTVTLAEKEILAAAGLTESERVQSGIEVENVDEAFRLAKAAIAEAKGRVSKSEMKQLTGGQYTAELVFEVAPDASGPMRDRLAQLGRTARLEISRVQTVDGGTPTKDAKITRGDTKFEVRLYNLANVAPRESTVLQLAVTDVPTGYQTLRDAVALVKGRVLTAQVNQQDRQNVSAQFDFEIRRSDEAAVRTALETAGEIVSRIVVRAPEGDAVTDTKVLYRATLFAATKVRPRESTVLAVEVPDVDAATAVIAAFASEAKGRQVDATTTHERNGRMTAKLIYDVPLAAAGGLAEKVKATGVVRVQSSTRDQAAPDGKFATARIEVTLANTEGIVAPDDGISQQIKKGLSYSASVLLMSVTWVVFGLCVVVPWAVVGYVGYRVGRRLFRKA